MKCIPWCSIVDLYCVGKSEKYIINFLTSYGLTKASADDSFQQVKVRAGSIMYPSERKDGKIKSYMYWLAKGKVGTEPKMSKTSKNYCDKIFPHIPKNMITI